MRELTHPRDPFNLSLPQNWRRIDDSDDNNFYVDPRLVVHVDEHFITALSRFLGNNLPPEAEILDLMSSYKSHLPVNYKPGKMVGLGMNAVEMKANIQLDQHLVQNLNQNPVLPFPDNTFDAVLNTVSVQYLTSPVRVFKEVGRVLKPGGKYIVSFSNRMFPTKAVQIWRELDDLEHLLLVEQYFKESGIFEEVDVYEEISNSRPGSNIWSILLNPHDPVFIVSGKKRS